MADRSQPLSAAECAALLSSVLECLDETSSGSASAHGDQLSLAAAHVQQAIELIQTLGDPDN